MKLIRYQGELSVSGTNVLMKLCLEKQRKIERVIERTEDRRTLKLLSKAWWAEFFKIEGLCGGNFSNEGGREWKISNSEEI